KLKEEKLKEYFSNFENFKNNGTPEQKEEYDKQKQEYDEGLKNALKEAGLDEELSDDSTESGRNANAILKAKKDKVIKDWNDNFTRTVLAKEGSLDDVIEAKIKALDDQILIKQGKDEITQQRDKKLQEFNDLENGGLSDRQKMDKDSTVEDLLRRLVQIEKDKKHTPKDSPKFQELVASEQLIKDEIGKIKQGDDYVLTDDDKNDNKERNKSFISAAEVEVAKLQGSLMTKHQKEEAKEEAEELEKKAERFQVSPTAYYASRDFRHMEHEEYSKLPQESMEYTELHEMIEKAINDKDVLKIHALFKKAANDYNDNEIWNAFGYDGGAEGVEKFRQDILEKKAGMGRQASMGLISEINYINEDKGHNNVSRMYGVKGGAFYARTPYEQAAAVATETMKRPLRAFFQNSNRLAYGYESGTDGKYHLDLSGKLTIAQGQDDFAYRIGRREMNQSLLHKLMEDLDSLREMQRKGILTAKVKFADGDGKSYSIVEALEKMHEEEKRRGGATNFTTLTDQAHRVI
ncbi:MAG: hypothetical protein ACOZAJ_03075, partial [Patescibacteria group bacterium]